MDCELVLSAEVYHWTDGDTDPLTQSVAKARRHLVDAGNQATIPEVAADKGHHSNETLADCEAALPRTYIPERKMSRRCCCCWEGMILDPLRDFDCDCGCQHLLGSFSENLGQHILALRMEK